MLVVSRRAGQSILVGQNIEVFILEVDGSQVRVGINAPRAIRILRRELLVQVESENRRGAENHASDPAALQELADSLKSSPEANPD